MEDRQERYLEALRARHEAEREELRAALAGRRPRALRQIEKRQAAVENETRRILETIDGGER
jgi:hypothetical protein